MFLLHFTKTFSRKQNFFNSQPTIGNRKSERRKDICSISGTPAEAFHSDTPAEALRSLT